MEYGNPNDPLLRQVLPLVDETHTLAGFVADPLAEADAMAATGLIRKYKSRALLMVTGQCAINCRYCFRRHFPYDEQRLKPQDRQTVLDTLASSPEINEVIFQRRRPPSRQRQTVGAMGPGPGANTSPTPTEDSYPAADRDSTAGLRCTSTMDSRYPIAGGCSAAHQPPRGNRPSYCSSPAKVNRGRCDPAESKCYPQGRQ